MIRLSENARYIIDVLKKAGYHVSVVGGTVRDAFLGRHSDDCDITTDALPTTVRSLFEKTIDTGIKHGTVTVMIDSVPYEVTTYRVDGEYLDSRHPENVSFTDNIELDLARRDFTVNAMAYNPYDGLIDVFGGREDLDARIIRAVGDPYQRFTEDALRILRALRFSSVLDFDIEPNTAAALRALASGLAFVSRERILVEWRKLLSGARAYEIIKEYFDIISFVIPELSESSLPPRDAFLPLTATERELLLFACAGGASGFRSCAASLKMDNKTRDKGVCVLNNLICTDSVDDAFIKEYLIGIGDDEALLAARISEALGKSPFGTEAKIRSAIDNGAIRNLSMLKINGNDLRTIGLRGEAIGDTLESLLRAAALGECPNEREALIDLAKKIN